MTLTQWAKQQGMSWEKVASELSLLTMKHTRNAETGAPGHPLYSARLWRLRNGATKARPYELQALAELTDGEVVDFREGVE